VRNLPLLILEISEIAIHWRTCILQGGPLRAKIILKCRGERFVWDAPLFGSFASSICDERLMQRGLAH
jgi:hypothetical protein